MGTSLLEVHKDIQCPSCKFSQWIFAQIPGFEVIARLVESSQAAPQFMILLARSRTRQCFRLGCGTRIYKHSPLWNARMNICQQKKDQVPKTGSK